MSAPAPYRVRTRPEPRFTSPEEQPEQEGGGGQPSAPEAANDPQPSARSYEIGKGKPPPGWKPGFCPNPKGRGAGKKNLKTYVREAFNEKMKVRQGSRIVTMTKGEIGAFKLVNKWTEHGDTKAYDKIVEIMGEDAVRGTVAPTFENAEVRQETNRAVLDWYRDTILRTEADHD